MLQDKSPAAGVARGAFALLLTAFTLNAQAAVKPGALFSDHAVLQQGRELPVWGRGDEGSTVQVEIAGRRAQTQVKDGRWRVNLPALKAGGPYALTIRSSDGSFVTATDVLVGEVWLCSGQSNMDRDLGPRGAQEPLSNWQAEAASANYPQLRHFTVTRVPKDAPADDVQGRWEVTTPETVLHFTAVGYYFGRDLLKAGHAPVGLIKSAFGGTVAEAWTSAGALQARPELQSVYEVQRQREAAYSAALEDFRQREAQLMADYETRIAAAKAQGKSPPAKPAPPRDPTRDYNRPSVLHNGMIAPLQPYAIRGAIWYQGESNAKRGEEYRTLFPTMIADWRAGWGQGDFPFLFVQIAPHKTATPELRDAQLHTWRTVPNTAMVVITDHGDADDIHPWEKEPVGQRLALAARALVYGEKGVESSGPLFERLSLKGAEALLHFSHVQGGLVAQGGALKGFEVAGDDGRFAPAQARIQGHEVIVSSAEVPKISAVRYGWSAVPEVNLFNGAGLPASPFDSRSSGAARPNHMRFND